MCITPIPGEDIGDPPTDYHQYYAQNADPKVSQTLFTMVFEKHQLGNTIQQTSRSHAGFIFARPAVIVAHQLCGVGHLIPVEAGGEELVA